MGPIGPAQAATVVALWNMNEAPGSTVLVDSSANHINGTLGKHITLNGAVHSFPQVVRGNNNGDVRPRAPRCDQRPADQPGHL